MHALPRWHILSGVAASAGSPAFQGWVKGWATSDWGYAPVNDDSRAMARCIRGDVREIAIERLLYSDPRHPDPDGGGSLTAPETSYAYDADGNLTSITNPLGLDTTFDYDGLYRLVSQTLPDPDGAGSLDVPVTTFAYDAVGNRTSLTDPAGNETTWAYDNLDRVTSETNALDKSRTYVYDAASRLTEVTDRNGLVRELEYDNLDRLVTETWMDGSTTDNTLSFTYDDASRPTAAADD